MSPHVHVRLGAAADLMLALSLLVGRGPAHAAPATDDQDSDVALTLTDRGREVTNSIGMKLVRVKAGKFEMGSPLYEKPRFTNEGVLVEVEITKDYYLGVYEVTQRQYAAVMGKNPSSSSKDGNNRGLVKGVDTSDFPVETVSWDESVEFCKKLSERAAERAAGRTYRLPTEAEWEYACRGGAKKHVTYWTGDKLTPEQANFGSQMPKTVGSYRPNAWGLYDVAGNVYEWVADWIADFYKEKEPKRDPVGPAKGESKVIRGGSSRFSVERCRTADRCAYAPGTRHDSVGFRVAMTAR